MKCSYLSSKITQSFCLVRFLFCSHLPSFLLSLFSHLFSRLYLYLQTKLCLASWSQTEPILYIWTHYENWNILTSHHITISVLVRFSTTVRFTDLKLNSYLEREMQRKRTLKCMICFKITYLKLTWKEKCYLCHYTVWQYFSVSITKISKGLSGELLKLKILDCTQDRSSKLQYKAKRSLYFNKHLSSFFKYHWTLNISDIMVKEQYLTRQTRFWSIFQHH